MKSKYLNLCIGAAALLSLQGCDDLPVSYTHLTLPTN